MSFSSAEAGAGSQWLCLYYIIHARKCWGGRGDQSLWGLCVCTEEQYVVIKQSWKGIRNPCASVYSRHFLLITLRSLLQPACVTGFIFSIDTATSQWVLHIVLSLNLFEKKYSWCFSTLQIICIWSHSNIIYTINNTCNAYKMNFNSCHVTTLTRSGKNKQLVTLSWEEMG